MVKVKIFTCHRRFLKSTLIILGLAVSLGACDRFSQLLTPQKPTAEPAEEKSVESSATATLKSIQSTVSTTDTPEPTFTPPPIPQCVPQQSGVSLAEYDFEDYPEAILEYLNDGGPVGELGTTLAQLGLAASTPTLQQIDLNNDGGREIVLSLRDPNSETVVPTGTFLIYLCMGDQYGLSYQDTPEDEQGVPLLYQMRDLNDDGYTDLVTSSKSCGAHTCFEDIHIVSWDGSEIKNLMLDSTIEIPFPNIQLTDYDQDHIYTMEVVGKGYGSVGAGPQRDFTVQWEYDSKEGGWVSTETTVGPSNYRIHHVHDADDAMKRGEYQVALLLYDQAFNDPDLLEWGEPVNEQLTIGAYARYKSVVAYALLDELDNAELLLKEMTEYFPEDIPQRIYINMAQTFLDAFEKGGEIAGCQAAQKFAEENSSAVLRPLGPEVYGYANREYTAEDMCP